MTKLLIISFLALPLAGCGTVAAGLLGGAVGASYGQRNYGGGGYPSIGGYSDGNGYGYGQQPYYGRHRWHRRGGW